MNRAVKTQGFTIIELMLAMIFISVLLLSIAMTIIQIGAIYNKGTTLREVNQSARDISDELQRGISQAGTINFTTDYVLAGPPAAPSGGRLCLGSNSYIWNYAKAISTNATGLTKYGTAPNQKTPVLVRVPDAGKLYCAKVAGALTYTNIRAVDVAELKELLKPGDHDLGLHEFKFITPVPATAANDAIGQTLYSLQFTIGTNRVSALNTTQTACLPPSDVNADPLYCNIQQFTLVIRAGK